MKSAVRHMLMSSQWSPERLFRDGSQGAWFDFSDLSTVYQDSAGTTAGAVGQPLGLVFDKRGTRTERWSGPTAEGATAFNANGTVGVVGDVVTCTCTVNGTYGVKFTNELPAANTSYKATLTIVTNTAGKSVQSDHGAKTVSFGSTLGAKTAVFAGTVAIGGGLLVYVIGGVAGESFSFSISSLLEVPGNHVTQATATARPSLVLPTSYYAARADGVDDSLAATTGGGGSAGILICAAVTVNGGAGTNRSIFSDRGTNIGYGAAISAGNVFYLQAGTGAGNASASTAATLPVGETHVVTAWDDGVNLTAQVDNGVVGSAARPAVSAGTAGFTLFADNGAASSFFPGDCQALVYVKNPSAAAIAQIPLLKRWVGWKAGLSL